MSRMTKTSCANQPCAGSSLTLIMLNVLGLMQPSMMSMCGGKCGKVTGHGLALRTAQFTLGITSHCEVCGGQTTWKHWKLHVF